MDNEQRAELLLRKYGFDFDKISPKEITELIQKEIENFQEGSAEYIRVLCGYLYCIGDASNVCLIKKAKYEINFDVQCMIDDEWIESFGDKVTWLVLLGQTKEKIAACAKEHGFEHIVLTDTLEEAVRVSYEKAKEGEAVLLSPACASWGMFPNYEVRGRMFKELVHKLKES